jgi:hypothetical protein
MVERTAGSPSTGRSRARRNVVGKSQHRDEYVRLMEAGWSSLALERYALHRYAEEIPASTFRTYRAKQQISVPVSPWKNVDAEKTLDTLGIRAQLIQLQIARIEIDAKHEGEMSKLFGTTRGEIQTLNALLDSHKADLQDLGLFPKSADVVAVTPTQQGDGEVAPRARSLGDVLGKTGTDTAAMAKVLHMALPKTGRPTENGHGS